MQSIYPPQAKAIVFFLTNQESLAEGVIREFTPLLGPVEIQGPWHPFPKSHYYEKEMGPDLKRCLVGFKNIFEPHRLSELKNLARELEQTHSHQVPGTGYHRTINVDPGYVDLFKVVLASGKSGGQKVALSPDVYACTLLRFEKGQWIPFEWTYPDFKAPTYHGDLLNLRNSLKRDLLTTDD